jgi:hypothetical protein
MRGGACTAAIEAAPTWAAGRIHAPDFRPGYAGNNVFMGGKWYSMFHCNGPMFSCFQALCRMMWTHVRAMACGLHCDLRVAVING